MANVLSVLLSLRPPLVSLFLLSSRVPGVGLWVQGLGLTEIRASGLGRRGWLCEVAVAGSPVIANDTHKP